MDHFDFDLAGHETLFKFAAFVVVQTLVYLILSKSSGVFSGAARSASFRRPVERSESARRMAVLLAQMPRFGGEPSTPAAAGSQRGGRTSNDGGDVDVELELELMLIRSSFSS